MIRVEEAQLALLGEDAQRRPVEEVLGETVGPGEAAGGGQFDVDPGRKREPGGLRGRVGDLVGGLQEREAEVVGDDGARELPLLAQDLGEQPGVGVGGQAVDVVVGGHDGAGAAVAHRHLERGQDDVRELARVRAGPGRGCGRRARPSTRRSA